MRGGDQPRDDRGRFAAGDRAETSALNSAGTKRSGQRRDEFAGMLESSAAINAKKRGAESADDSDVDDAYRRLLSKRSRPRSVDIGAEIGLFVGGGLASYGLTLLTSAPPSTGPGWTILAVGGLFGAFSATLKHTDWN